MDRALWSGAVLRLGYVHSSTRDLFVIDPITGAAPDDPIPESNACGNVGWNCIVFADGSLRPLEFDGATAEFPVPLEQGRNSGFRVLPDEILQLSIVFDANSSVLFTSDSAVHLVPVFRVAFHTLSLAASAE